jgi:hypothetical protein
MKFVPTATQIAQHDEMVRKQAERLGARRAVGPSEPAVVNGVRTVRLRVIGGSLEIRDDVPKRRDLCPTERDRLGRRVCGHVHCEWHLWMVDRRDRPGRFRDRLTSELRPVWIATWPLPPMCGADVLEQAHAEDWTLARLAAAIGLSRRGLNWMLLKAKSKLRTDGATLPGFEEDERI